MPPSGEPDDVADEIDLGRRDLSFVEPIYPVLSWWVQTYFRAEVDGLERIPPDPVLFVANHSGGFGSPDSIVFILSFMDRFGLDRPLHWLGHDALFDVPVLNAFLRRCGVVPATSDVAQGVLEAGGSVVVYPGGEEELHRPWSERNEIQFHGRQGFLRLARDAGVPLVPVVGQGGHDTYLPLSDGNWLARTLRLDRLLRVKTLPVALSFPWGLTVGHIPHLPLPARIRLEVLDPIDVAAEFGDDLDAAYDAVTGRMQATLERLAARG